MLEAVLLTIAVGLTAARLMTVAQMAMAITLSSGIETLTIWDVQAYSWLVNAAHFVMLQAIGEGAYFLGLFWLFWQRDVKPS